MSASTSLTNALGNGLRKLVGKPAKASAYRMFDVQLKAIVPLSPSLTRFVFGGEDVAQMHTLAADQRIKMFFPSADGQPPQLPKHGAWQDARRALSAEQSPPMRTYTIRQLRREAREVDVEFVLHGVNGPASAWATQARVGDRLQMVAPNLAYDGDPGGYEWRPPKNLRNLLLIGDETALPAIAGILEQLARDLPEVPVQAFIEVPGEADCLELTCSPATRLNWLPRDVLHCTHGEAMIHAIRELAQLPPTTAGVGHNVKLEEVDIDRQILWELAKPCNGEFYAWIAGESAAVMNIRRYLISERGLDRSALTLMGYWRAGRTFD
ncbi:siderophore-interacting protein [Pseudomonas rubra]|uniref:Siderophore-interacting protein n=1 Tax=Pseudomonas rubra TaxID=2942627 RepID=A0ABT5P9B0_9PSED|nr:siderophore-interacting protein [Pseudomonas rubra]MDD1014584.1 siderophore-interacting protein [Pseudomonas rubra]MDD1040533.1 siderophore-interacting protein [Pseudomonas rubra]MDD1153623.1 siderophore-interacting protein [Pseudomonas rubra]